MKMNLKAKNGSRTIDMVNGPLYSKLIVFAIPMVISGLLQLLFNAADIAVVGKFTGSDALAAVGASGPISSLIVSLFMGLSVGANVMCAQYIGARRPDDLHETVHTAIGLALIVGVAMIGLGQLITTPLLRVLGTPEAVLPLAEIYLRIYFAGMPVMLLYNFGAAVLRSAGDTRRPMIYLTLAGVLNIALNLFTVIVLGMGVAGVAIATVTSQALAAVLVVRDMLRTQEDYRLELRRVRIHRRKLANMLRIGVPAAIEGVAFSVSNLLIQSSINSLGPAVMAATTAAWSIDGFCYVGCDALGQAATSFTGQNYGAHNFKRIDRIFRFTVGVGAVMLIILGVLAWLFSDQLLAIYTNDPNVIVAGRDIMFIVCVFAVVDCLMNIPFNMVRGMGHAVFPMVSSLFCICVLRLIWVYTAFEASPTVTVLFISYPLTKGICAVTAIAYFFYIRRKQNRMYGVQRDA